MGVMVVSAVLACVFMFTHESSLRSMSLKVQGCAELTVRALIQKPLRSGQGSLSFCGFSEFVVGFLGFPAGVPALPALL